MGMVTLFKGIDPSTIYLIAGILVVVAIVLSIVKRAIKLGIIILIIALAVSIFGPKGKDRQELGYSNVYDNMECMMKL